jgi:Fe-S cluster biogenesis protein NfuA
MIQTEPTPNPNALKFIPLREVRGSKPPLFYKKDSDKNPSEKSNIVNSLFGIKGINDVFFGSDFITIGKNDSVQWEDIKEPIVYLIEANRTLPFVEEEVKPACETINNDAGESKVIKTIKRLLDERVRPAVAMDGGDILFHGYHEGIVKLEMYGACSGCPSSSATLKMGVENMLKHYIPEVRKVEQVYEN